MRPTFLLLIVLVLICAHAPAGAQQPTKVPRIGYLQIGLRQRSSFPLDWSRRGIFESFRHGLRELGYVEGQNVILQPRFGDDGQLPDLAADLVQLKVDVIVAQTPASTYAAMKATNTIPIVMNTLADPVLLGFVASLERPGGNVTGVSGLNLELGGKWLELVKETVPSAKRVAVFWNMRAEIQFPIWKSVELAARSLGVDLQWLQVRNSGDVARGFTSAVRERAAAFVALPGFGVGSNLQGIAELGLKNRLPGIFWRTDLNLEQWGVLMAYGANRLEQSRRAAYVVDKILKGAKPAELPVELAKSFELVINLKAAKELGITVPPRVLAWADKVIK